eukprot:SAG31_NODE_21056_length_558_cov_3.222222_1_plen_63_part_10
MICSIADPERRRGGNQHAPQVGTVVLAGSRGFSCSHGRLEISRQVRRIKTEITELGAHELDGF